jgi:hypothetical protein
MLVDPVGNSVREMSQNNDYEPMKGKIRHGIWLQLPKLTTNAESEAQLYEKLLVDTLYGDVDAVKVAFDSIRQLRSPHLDPLQTVAAVGAIKGHMSVVQFAPDRGVRYD